MNEKEAVINEIKMIEWVNKEAVKAEGLMNKTSSITSYHEAEATVKTLASFCGEFGIKPVGLLVKLCDKFGVSLE